MLLKSFFHSLLIGACALALGLGFGAFTALKYVPASFMEEVKEDSQEIRESTDTTEAKETLEQIEFEGENYAILKQISVDKDGQYVDVIHLCKPETVFGTYHGEELSDPIQCGWGSAERLVMRQGTRISALDIAGADRSGYRYILMGARLFPDGQKLMVVFEEDQCMSFLGLCIDARDSALLFNISNGAYLGALELTDYVFDVNGLIFNKDATKYIHFAGCPEGCPDHLVEGYDLKTKKSFDFIDQMYRYEDDGLWFPDEEKSQWIDADTFRLVAKDGEKTKTVDLDFQ